VAHKSNRTAAARSSYVKSEVPAEIKQALGPNLEYGVAVEGLAASECWIETFKRGQVGEVSNRRATPAGHTG